MSESGNIILLTHAICCSRARTQMPKEVKDAKMCILTCPFEPPKPKTKHHLEIKDAASYQALHETEQKYFTDMVAKIKSTCVLCLL